jgi:2-methylcitrate dehydratase PrpD
VKPLGGIREAGVIGTRHVTSVLNAALANGTCGHADETDDTHPPTRTHPGTSVIPAALAVAEKHALTGQQFMRAMVLGYDMCARTLLALNPRKLVPTGRHAGATGQVFGASGGRSGAHKAQPAASAPCVVIYIAADGPASRRCFVTRSTLKKPMRWGGMPAHNGVQAALMVASGFTGVEDIYAGDPDFFRSSHRRAIARRSPKGLGQTYEIMRGGIKRWSVGGPIQGPMARAVPNL